MELYKQICFGIVVVGLGILLLRDITQNFKDFTLTGNGYRLYLVALACMLLGFYLIFFYQSG
ncbi:hypothetical protein SAMN05421820_103709 [Pedobacter steynii]|uniref:Uncharacterized protein n=1 Tax=Pedobacter steynii TaxID=430522 RepID=A0A1G9SUG9_9SPHI|nr:hypothetical protein [Pedobacter steynii]NQX37318.1 hypothetical protein [Pedobacter steynii]SDM39076.1 hypothetical protein SAMN05421820_103709 [Pedobacter steynii]